MARDDMFNWLLRKKKGHQAEPQPQPTDALVEATSMPIEATPPAPEVQPVTETLKPAEPSQSEPPPAEEPVRVPEAAPAPEPVVVAAEKPASAVGTPAPTAQQARPAYAGLGKAKRLVVLQRSGGEALPSAGLAVVEHNGRQKRQGVLVGVRADGRRLLANLGPTGGIRAYTLRDDGAYRLEGAIDARAPVLTLARDG